MKSNSYQLRSATAPIVIPPEVAHGAPPNYSKSVLLVIELPTCTLFFSTVKFSL